MLIRTPEQDVERILFSEDMIASRVEALADELTKKFEGERPVFVCVLKGAAFFFIDLCRKMKCHLDMDFIAVSSYGSGVKSNGSVRLIKDLNIDISNRHVVLVEDIVDSGLTLKYLRNLYETRNPASITTVSFLDKCGAHDPSMKTDYYGFEVENEFVVGYGLDYANYYRNLPYIGILKPECYQ